MKIKKLTYLEPVKASRSRKLFLDCAELHADDYAELRRILDKLGLIDGHPHDSHVAEKSTAITIAIEIGDETKITCLPSDNQPDDVVDLIDFIKAHHTGGAPRLQAAG